MSCSFLVLSEVFNQFPPPVHVYVCLCYADDRLVSILRHHNFLKELQEIAVKGESQIKHGCCLFWAPLFVYVMVDLISPLLLLRDCYFELQNRDERCLWSELLMKILTQETSGS